MIRMTRWSVSIQSSLTPPYGTLLMARIETYLSGWNDERTNETDKSALVSARPPNVVFSLITAPADSVTGACHGIGRALI